MENATKDATTSGASNEIVPSCGAQHVVSDLLAVWSNAMISCASTTAQACETMDELAAKLQSWATSGVKPGTADYVAMLRQMNPEAKHQCKELKSPSLKEQIRREWSERRLAKHNEGRRTGSSWTEIDTSHGVYMNAAQLALDGGFLVDPEGSIERAKTMMSRCVQMGGSWIDIDRQTDEVLHVGDLRRTQGSACS